MKKLSIFLLLSAIICLASCSNNYSNGERIGTITQFSKTGLFFKSWEGHLNVTQTGMNSAAGWDFSLDNDDKELESRLAPILDSATINGWKVKLIYHAVEGFNWFSNRGHTDYFLNNVIVLDRNFTGSNSNNNYQNNSGNVCGRTIDTIYVVIERVVHTGDKGKENTLIYVGDK